MLALVDPELPRIALDIGRLRAGRMRQLIDRLNALPADPGAQQPTGPAGATP